MADEPIDINKAKRNKDRDMEISAYLHAMFHQVMETHNQLKLRARDIDKDADELFTMFDAMMAEFSEKYPELFPELEKIEEHEDS